MIVIVSSANNARECALALEKQTGERCVFSSTIREGAYQLKSQEFTAVVLDQALVDSTTGSMDMMWKHAGAAIVVTVNFAISGADRVVREVKAALRRREKEHSAARRAAEAGLRSELTGPVTGILLSSEIALAQPELPALVANKLRSVHELALQMKQRLGPAA
jgi:hypothetical protein